MNMPRHVLGYLTLLLALAASSPAARAGSYVDFFRAVNIDNPRAVGALLAQGFDPNARSEQGHTALYLAIRDGSPQVERLLLAQPGLDVDARNAVGETALMMAAMRGHRDTVDALLARGARVHQEGWNALHYAACSDTAEGVGILRLLLARGAQVDARAPDGDTALILAARLGTEAEVDALLQAGADRSLRNGRGEDAEAMARGAGRDYLAARLRAASGSGR